MCKLSRNPFESPGAKPHYAPNQILTLKHSDIRLKVDIPSKSVKCHVSHIVSRHPTAPFDPSLRTGKSLTLNAVGFFDLQIHSLPTEAQLTHTYDGKLLILTWTDSFEPAQERRVDISYTVKSPVSGLFFSYPDSDYPHLPIYAITDHETERCRYWLPCIDYPSVRMTLSFEITCPSNFTSIANGALVNVSVKDGFKVTQYKLDHPCPSYLICWAVGEFTKVEDTPVDDIAISYFAPTSFPKEDILRSFEKTPSMIKWLQEKLSSPFPWPKYFQIAAADVGGAMENISLVTWNDRYIMDETWAKERKLLMDLVNIHEMAHTYFGDLIVIRHFDQVWMKESWATYMESCWLEDHIGKDAFRYEMFINAEQYMKETESYMRPIVQRSYASSWSLFDNHTYPGGACRIHMLRSILGDQCFWTAVRKYVAAYRGSVVETEDFRKILEFQSGLNLIPFFDQWFYGKGFPNFKVTYEFDSEKKSVKISAEQTQVDLAKSVPLFQLSLEVEILDAEGKVHSDLLQFENDQKCVLVLSLGDSKPVQVRLDPNGKILASFDFNPGEEILANNAKSAPDVVTRIRSYRQLIKIGTLSAFEKVKSIIISETFYGVRVHVAEALAESKLRLALDVLSDMLLSEKDPMAMWQIAKCCKIVDSKLRSSLKKFLSLANLPYRAREFALESLGYQIQTEDFGYLITIAKDDKQLGQHNFIRAGALRSLSYFPTSEAFDYLYERVSKRGLEPFRLARATAVDSLVRNVTLQVEKTFKKKTVELLRCLVLNDPDVAVRKTCVNGLVTLEAKEAAGEIETSKSLFAEQDWEWVDSQIKRLNDPKDSSFAELNKKIETLETRLRSLEEKIMESNHEVKNA